MRCDPILVSGELSSLAAIRTYVKDAAEAAGLARKDAYRLQLAVDEIATNIVLHGYFEAGLAGDVQVEAEFDDAELRVTLTDWGAPFDPHSLSRPEQIDMPLAERPVGGLGVFLAMENVDRYEYRFVEGSNRNTFIVNRP